MSGGPILGFMNAPDGKLLYTIAAVQSWWDKDRRIAFGTRLPPVMSIVERIMNSQIAERMHDHG
jgi:hypothetical protein